MAEQRLSQDVDEFLSSTGAEIRVGQDVDEFMLVTDGGGGGEFRISQDVSEFLYSDAPAPPVMWMEQDVDEFLFTIDPTPATEACITASSYVPGPARQQSWCD